MVMFLKVWAFIGRHFQAFMIIAITLALIGLGYYVKGVMAQNTAFKKELDTKTERIQAVESQLEELLNSVEDQENKINELNSEINKVDAEAKAAVQVFKKHDLHDLSAKKPGLVEARVNKATQNVFSVIQQDTEHFQQEVSK